MAIASLVLGIIAIVFEFLPVPGLGWIAVILAIVGIVLGALGRKRDPQRAGMATAGLVISIIALVLGLIVAIACAACVGVGLSALSSM